MLPPRLSPPSRPVPPKLGQSAILPIWSSKGVKEKPSGCSACPFRTSSSGFVPDWYPDSDGRQPQLGFLLDFPSSDEVLENRPWAGRAGYLWEKLYLKPFGLSLGDVFIGHVLRCQPKERKFGKPVYPTASLKRSAELRCRQFDAEAWDGPKTRPGGLHKFNPDLFVVTFHPSDALVTPAYSRLIKNDIGRAVEKMRQGRRPLVLMGDESKDLVAPWLRNSVKTWRGTFWEGTWPFAEGSALVEPELGFLEV